MVFYCFDNKNDTNDVMNDVIEDEDNGNKYKKNRDSLNIENTGAARNNTENNDDSFRYLRHMMSTWRILD